MVGVILLNISIFTEKKLKKLFTKNNNLSNWIWLFLDISINSLFFLVLIMVERMKKWVGGEEVVAGTNEAANETTPQPPAIAHPASTTAPAVSTPSTYFNMTTVNSSSETTPSTVSSEALWPHYTGLITLLDNILH